jgi:hypothetical protein
MFDYLVEIKCGDEFNLLIRCLRIPISNKDIRQRLRTDPADIRSTRVISTR